jgi:phage-related minor tail protein
MQKQFEELIKLENQVAAGATAIGNAFSNAFVGVISGAKSAQEGLAEMMQSVAKHFLDMATKIIAEQIAMILYGTIMKALGVSMPGGSSFNPNAPSITGDSLGDFGDGSFGGFMANGGPVSANTPYIVGERGPELMIPSTSGMVLSNSETRQQLTQQGSAMRSTEATRQQLNTQRNTMITNSTRETERMTEMMLSNPDPIDVRYESTVINNVEYVTAEQHRQGMAQAAERGRSLTLSALQSSVKTRKKVGLS